MTDFSEEISSDAAPFKYVGMDMFGPFLTIERRKEFKDYAAIFTWLAGRAIHLEVVNSIETDPFIMCLKRFVGWRGNVRMLMSVNGISFIGAEKKLSKGFLKMDQNKSRRFLQNMSSNWIIWKKNSPAGSCFGGFLRVSSQVSKGSIGIIAQSSWIQLQ